MYLQVENMWVQDQNDANAKLKYWSELHFSDRVVSVTMCYAHESLPGYIMTIAYYTKTVRS